MYFNKQYYYLYKFFLAVNRLFYIREEKLIIDDENKKAEYIEKLKEDVNKYRGLINKLLEDEARFILEQKKRGN